jgi:hypothetical protein
MRHCVFIYITKHRNTKQKNKIQGAKDHDKEQKEHKPKAAYTDSGSNNRRVGVIGM